MKTKPFDKKLYDQNDAITKEIFLFHFNKKTKEYDRLEENYDKFGPDIIAYKDNKEIFYIELDRILDWTCRDGYQYNKVYFPFRKRKYLDLDMKTHFCRFNNRFDKIMKVSCDTMMDGHVETITNKLMPDGETIINIDVSKTVIQNVGRRDGYIR